MNEKKAKTDVVWAETDCSRTERIAAGQNGLQGENTFREPTDKRRFAI